MGGNLFPETREREREREHSKAGFVRSQRKTRTAASRPSRRSDSWSTGAGPREGRGDSPPLWHNRGASRIQREESELESERGREKQSNKKVALSLSLSLALSLSIALSLSLSLSLSLCLTEKEQQSAYVYIYIYTYIYIHICPSQRFPWRLAEQLSEAVRPREGKELRERGGGSERAGEGEREREFLSCKKTQEKNPLCRDSPCRLNISGSPFLSILSIFIYAIWI